MKKPLVIFGSGIIAELANYYFTNDSDYDVVAFTVDENYFDQQTYCNKPVVPFEHLLKFYTPKDYSLFIALSYSEINAQRKKKYFDAKSMGYKLATYISSYATVLNNGQIGENCFILEDNTIQPFVHIGNNVTLWSGNHVGHHSTVKDHCFISSHVVISGGVHIGEQCFIGVNATLRDHITVGERCVIGAGALIMKDTPADSLYIANATECASRPSSTLKKI